MSYVTLIPYKNEYEIENFVKSDYMAMNENLKAIIPDVRYFFKV
jgi:hypothetical protein